MPEEIAITAFVAGLLLLVEHWLPWRMIFKRDMPRVLAYILGVLAMALPLTALLVRWREYDALAALWAVIVFSGLSVMGAYLVDWLLGKVVLASELSELIQQNEVSNELGRSIE